MSEKQDWRPFEAARAYVREIGLKSSREYKAWSKSGQRPSDIPGAPWTAYKEWLGFADWLGTHIEPRPFAQAREFVQLLGLPSSSKYKDWAKTGARPPDIPLSPESVYKNDWGGWRDWLGTRLRLFTEAREYVRGLRLVSSTEYLSWARSPGRPRDIPISPPNVYKVEWQGWDDWLGVVQDSEDYLPFEEARSFCQQHGFTTRREYFSWCDSAEQARRIPRDPRKIYPSQWKGWTDWLGIKGRPVFRRGPLLRQIVGAANAT